MVRSDRIVWITGASSGIGEALAHAFSSTGARLVLSASQQPAGFSTIYPKRFT